MKCAGFTQLGRRISPLEKREYSRRIELSVICVDHSGKDFKMAAFERTAELVFSWSQIAELILIRLDPGSESSQALLEEFPWLRIIIPTRRIGFGAALDLGAREALGQRLLVIDTSTAIAFSDFRLALERFNYNRKLFALGPILINQDGSEVAARLRGEIKEGRIVFSEEITSELAPSLGLPSFYGFYDREKVLFLGPPDDRLESDWSMLDWFCSAWGRGWSTLIDPAHCFYLQGAWPFSFGRKQNFLARVTSARHERGFLRKYHQGERESEEIKKSRPGLSGLIARLWPRRFARRSQKAFYTLDDVLRLDLDPGSDEDDRAGQDLESE